jgi:hypothetical protein
MKNTMTRLLLASALAFAVLGSAGKASAQDSGTALSATGDVGGVACTSTEEATVTLSGVLTSTGSVDSAVITASVNGGEPVELGTLNPEDFSRGSRAKTANYSVTLSLPNGTHSVELCLTQSGSQGREPKRACATVEAVSVACAPENACSGASFFGNLVGNPSLCTGNGPPHIPVHFRGDFGESASLLISGPNGYGHSATLQRAGVSCNYHYNWQPTGNDGDGSYTFTAVSAAGDSYSFSANLSCE